MDEFKKLMSILLKVEVSKGDFNYICGSKFVELLESTGTVKGEKSLLVCYKVKLSNNNFFNIKVNNG